MTIPQLNDLSAVGMNFGLQEYYVELDNVTIPGASGNWPTHANLSFTLSDGTNTGTGFFWPSSYSNCDPLAGTPMPTGTVNMTGLVSVFGASGTYPNVSGGTAEFTPFTITPVPEPASLTLFLLGLSAAGILISRQRE